jgi:outer membrane protein assembly factor BamB
MVTSSDGAHDFLVWGLGVGGDQKLHAFDGDTGQAVYTSPAMANLARFMTPVEAKGRVYVAGTGTVTAFTAQ